jgi:hypothetical protein
MDDASGALLPGARFTPEEDTVSYLRLLQTLVRSCGIPVALYMDRHSIFRRNDPAWSLAEELRGRQDPTQVGRALDALGIEVIYALSPQAKGRIERLWGTLQDRLVAELRLAGSDTLAAANAFLPAFTQPFNARFARPPADLVPAWRPVPRGLDLDRICSLYTEATVLNDNTVRTQGTLLQIPPGPGGRGYAKARVEVRQLLDGSWRIYYHDRLIATQPARLGPPQHSLRRRRYRSAPPRATRQRLGSEKSVARPGTDKSTSTIGSGSTISTRPTTGGGPENVHKVPGGILRPVPSVRGAPTRPGIARTAGARVRPVGAVVPDSTVPRD